VTVSVGDIFETRFTAYAVRHEVVAVEADRVLLRVHSSSRRPFESWAKASDYRFWLDIETVEQYWVSKKLGERDPAGLERNREGQA
jgi:hypothetical protein